MDGKEAEMTLSTVNTLGNVLSRLDQHEQAIELLAGNVEARRRTLGPQHEGLVKSLIALASAYERSGDAGAAADVRAQLP